MEKDVRGNLLLDFYGNMLTGKQQEIMKLYFECDTGISEIALMLNSSRQAIYDAIKVAEKSLDEIEKKLGLVEKYLENRNMLLECISILNSSVDLRERVDILKVVETLQKVLENL